MSSKSAMTVTTSQSLSQHPNSPSLDEEKSGLQESVEAPESKVRKKQEPLLNKREKIKVSFREYMLDAKCHIKELRSG